MMLGILTSTNYGSRKVSYYEHILVDVNKSSCDIQVSETNISRPDVYALSLNEWSNIFEKCEIKWRVKYLEEFKIVDNLASWDVGIKVPDDPPPDDKKLVYILTLFAYEDIADVPFLATYFSTIKDKFLRLDAYKCILKRIQLTKHSYNARVLNLAYAWINENVTLPEEMSSLVNTTIYDICSRLSLPDNSYYNVLSYVGGKALQYFLPKWISTCFEVNFPPRLRVLLNILKYVVLAADSQIMRYNHSSIACYGYELILHELRERKLLNSILAQNTKEVIKKVLRADKVPHRDRCNATLQELEKHNLDIESIINQHRERELQWDTCAQYLKADVLPALIKLRYKGNSASTKDLVDSFRHNILGLNDHSFICRALELLAKEIAKHNRTLAFDFFHLLFSFPDHILYKNHIYNKIDNDCDYVSSTMPSWISDYLIKNLSQTCDSSRNTTCRSAFRKEITTIQANFKKDNVTGMFETLFIDYVIKSMKFKELLVDLQWTSRTESIITEMAKKYNNQPEVNPQTRINVPLDNLLSVWVGSFPNALMFCIVMPSNICSFYENQVIDHVKDDDEIKLLE
jgi:hypothetical protein